MHTLSQTARQMALPDAPDARSIAQAIIADLNAIAARHVDGRLDMGASTRHAADRLRRQVLRELLAADRAFAPVVAAWHAAQAAIAPMSWSDHGDMIASIEDFEAAAEDAAQAMRDEAAHYAGEVA